MQRQSLKARILDHAETRLLEQGFRGMRVDELARDVGISKRTLYEQFRTKEEMAREALTRLAQKLHEAIEAISSEQVDEAVRLRAIVFRICETYSRARPPFYRDLEATPSLTELVEASRARSFAQVEKLVRSGIASGNFRAELDPRIVRRTLIAAVDTVIRPEVLSEDRLSLEQAFDAIIDLILHGMFETPVRRSP
ncbi:MAG: TetR/AcrR family transcriptional regulator [Enhygromyxa sp.]